MRGWAGTYPAGPYNQKAVVDGELLSLQIGWKEWSNGSVTGNGNQ